jgi:ATP-dependent Lon protease
MSNIAININIYKDIEEKISFLKEMIKDSFSAMQKYKMMDVISGNEVNSTINFFDILSNKLNNLSKKLMTETNIDCESIYNEISQIKKDLLSIFSTSGTKYFEKLVILLLDNKNIENIDNNKYELLCKYTHPISYKVLEWKNYYHISNKNKKYIQKNKIVDDKMIIENANNLECLDLSRTNKTFQIQVYGIKVILHNSKKKETYFLSCLVDDILVSCIDNYFISDKYSKLDSEKPKDNEYKSEDWENFKKFLTLKDFLILNNNEIYNKYISILTQNNFYKQKNISQIVNEFLNSDLYVQRNILINLLVKSNNNEYQYLSYLLYDLLSNDNQSSIDTIEQTMLYDSLPWHCKIFFKNAMKQTINYTNQLCNYDESKIPLEQQICLMKASNNIKEKAMVKLKEIKAKSEDTGSKARHYLDGLLKIPFGIYKEEYILSIKKELNSQFIFLLELPILKNIENFTINKKKIYTIIEIKNIIKNINENILPEILINIKNDYIINVKKLKKPALLKINTTINNFISNNNYNYENLVFANKKNEDLINNIQNFINSLKEEQFLVYIKITPQYENEYNNINLLEKNILDITDKIDTISQYMKNVKSNLTSSVYGHDNAKEQIETIIAQWINGENSGYCFGFEGPPGIGKTSLAKKGISKCLQDQDGKSRPFSFIAIGGSSNGSTLEGHNYTYVGSTWGKIVDVLMENKCMNPIIFIDELDKISKTEHGREIIGILTHLIDYTQNDSFQDKYFNGIDLDLSKVLFIFSYNDVDAIDKILLDRIHRIKFKHLSLEEKITICKDFILPELYKKVGFENVINFSDNVLINIINNYTCEPGVRKLKEILFEIVGKINLNLLNNTLFLDTSLLPLDITYEEVKNNYLKNRNVLNIKNIISEPNIGIINGLWANSLGQGGLLYIEVKKIISSTLFELKLTGMQGDVMKESMNVAKTVAIEKYMSHYNINIIIDDYKNIGLHIHVPEGATPKDGPSAGAAITTAIYSILMKKKINNLFALTGEISLQGLVTEIGGLDLKILGGIKSGAKKFIYPKGNAKDFDEFFEKYKENEILEGIEFYSVENIDEVLKLVLLD